MHRGESNKNTLEWQQISSIPSSENIIKYVKIEVFMVVIFCNLVRLGHYSYPSFERFPFLLGSIGS